MYRFGCEAPAEYNESLADLTEGPAEYLGTGDHRVQSYSVLYNNAGVDGHVQIDTVRWLWIGE